jgi:mannose-6-phosphate isomerase-like protein (cupin superfamily)
VASIHLLDVKAETRTHYHRRMTEIYYVLEGYGHLELDGTRAAVRPGQAVLIKPGCRHRALGSMRLLVIPIPAFDPADEFFDEPPAAVGHSGG